VNEEHVGSTREGVGLVLRATRIGGGDWFLDIQGWGTARCDEGVIGSILADADAALHGPIADDPTS